MKKIIAIILFISLTTHGFEWREFLGSLLQGKLQLSPESNNGYDLSEAQARDYVDKIGESFNQLYVRRLQKRTLQDILFLIKQAVRRSQQPYITASGKTYSRELIDQFIMRTLVEYCEKTAFTYAYKQTRNQTLSQEIGTLVRNEVANRIDHKVLDFEKLLPFLDQGLQRFVDKELKTVKSRPQVTQVPTVPKAVADVVHPIPSSSDVWDEVVINR